MMEFTDSAKLVHLKLCSVFQELSTGILAELARQTSHRQIEPGEALLEEGKVGEKIFVLTAGNLIVSKGTNAEEIADIKPVALVGEMEALSPLNTPNFASVKADKDGAGAVVLEIGRDEFLEFLGDQPEVMRSIIAHMARNLMATADRLDEVTHGPRDFDDRLKRFDSLLDSIEAFRVKQEQTDESLTEFQKKFKVNATVEAFLHWVESLAIPIKKKQFDQVYLPCHTEGGEIRLRADDDESRLSIARKTDSGSRVRLETELEKHIYQVLRCQAAGHPITKTRYTFFYEGLEWRFDVFAEESHLAGLHLLEVTLPVKDARFTLPPPFKGSEDVTGNPEYDNKSLALSKGE